MDTAFIVWLIIGAVALVVDLATSSFLFVWFTIGALAAIVAEIFNFSIVVQIIIFALVSVICMIVGYPIIKKSIKISVKPTPTREITYIGKIIDIDGDMEDKQSLKMDGVYWKIAHDEENIKEGDKVRVLGLRGNKVIIEKI